MKSDLDIEQALSALGRAVSKADPGGVVEVRIAPSAMRALEEQMAARDVASLGERLDHRDAATGDLVILGATTVIIRPRTVRREP